VTSKQSVNQIITAEITRETHLDTLTLHSSSELAWWVTWRPEMRALRLCLLAVAFSIGLVGSSLQLSAGETEVDLALVLAVDVSWSMDPDEQELQREGFIEAFRSPLVHDAIRKGMLGRIAVTYFEWASATHQQVIVPWTVLDGPEGALAFADRLSRRPPGRAFYTSVSGALDFGVGLLAQSNVEATRQVIDISGDGANNDGRAVVLARDEAVRSGVVINGLPIMLKRPTLSWDIEDLDFYYQDCVIGGLGAFLVSVRHRNHFAEAIRTKIIREIAEAPEEPLLRPAQAKVHTNCMTGEMPRQQRWGN
jgi:hypothetical protein